MFGLDLHGWEQVMVASLLLAGFIAVVIGVSTFLVVKLQRIEAKASADAIARYKEEAGRDIANANERAAEANQNAAEAKLELEKYKAPRILTSEQIKHIKNKLRQFGEVKFDVVSVSDEESGNFAYAMLGVLTDSGWKFIHNMTGLAGSGAGIIVSINDNWPTLLKESAYALINVLKDEGIEEVRAQINTGAVVNNEKSEIINIMVLSKPVSIIE